jgi:hypothetical protein
MTMSSHVRRTMKILKRAICISTSLSLSLSLYTYTDQFKPKA